MENTSLLGEYTSLLGEQQWPRSVKLLGEYTVFAMYMATQVLVQESSIFTSLSAWYRPSIHLKMTLRS